LEIVTIGHGFSFIGHGKSMLKRRGTCHPQSGWCGSVY